MLILIFSFLFVFIANYWHWIRCQRTNFFPFPLSGWPQVIYLLWVFSLIPLTCLQLLDLIPANVMAFHMICFTLTLNIYSIFDRERRFQKNSKPSDQPVSH